MLKILRIKFLGILMVGTGLAIIFLLWKFNILFGLFLFQPWISSKAYEIYPNKNIADIISIISSVTVYLVIYFTFKIKKNYGIILLVILLILQSIFSFYIDRNRYYSIHGKQIKYYTKNPLTGKINIFDKQIFDEFGQKAQPVDLKVAMEIYRKNNYDKFPEKEVPFSEFKRFFDSQDGNPLAYYYEDESGIHLFMHDGYDEMSGKKLLPVTYEITEKCKKALTKKESMDKVNYSDRINLVINTFENKYMNKPTAGCFQIKNSKGTITISTTVECNEAKLSVPFGDIKIFSSNNLEKWASINVLPNQIEPGKIYELNFYKKN